MDLTDHKAVIHTVIGALAGDNEVGAAVLGSLPSGNAPCSEASNVGVGKGGGLAGMRGGEESSRAGG